MSESRRAIVLMYHRVGEFSNAWEARYAISSVGFAGHMAALAKNGYRAVPIDALVNWLEGGPSLPAGAFVLTFDDGFRGVRDHALPLLEALGWPFAVFLVSELIGEQDVWTRASNPDGRTYPLLSAQEIRDMQRRGVSFHSHTRSHASLPDLDDAGLLSELSGSRTDLHALLGQPVDYLAYPYGHVDDRVESAARRAGYRAAFSTRSGFNRREVNRFGIRRVEVFGTDTPAHLLRKVRLGDNDGSLAHLARYYLSRLTSRLRVIRP